jgi:Asp/Glu/hydantoin racemase
VGEDFARLLAEWYTVEFDVPVCDGLRAQVEQSISLPELNLGERVTKVIRAHTEGKAFGTI